jgi:hypothetical protein
VHVRELNQLFLGQVYTASGMPFPWSSHKSVQSQSLLDQGENYVEEISLHTSTHAECGMATYIVNTTQPGFM